jgi:hypothetical protein
MIAATLLAVFHVPLFFKVLYDRRIRETRSHDELINEVRHVRHVSHVTPQTPGHPPFPKDDRA